MSEEAILQFLQENHEYFTTNNFMSDAFRTLGWWAVQGLTWILDGCTTLYDWTFGLVNITAWTGLDDFISQFDPLVKALLVLSLTILGFMFVMGKGKKHTLFSSILIFAVVTISSSYLFSQLNLLSIAFKDAIVDGDTQDDGAELVRGNLYDLLYVDSEIGLENMTPDQVPQYGTLTMDELDYININQVVNTKNSDLTEPAKNILGKRLNYVKGSVGSTLADVSNGWGWNSEDDTDLGNEFYYRYTFHYGTFYIAILALVIIYICLSYKNTRIVYELFVSRIMAVFFANDMTGNQKIVKILTGIRDGYYALCLTAIAIKSFTVFQMYLGTQTQINAFARAIIVLFVAFCVIDGANIIEKITGTDAGLSSMTGKMIAATQIARSLQQQFGQHRMNKNMENQQKALVNMQQQTSAGNGFQDMTSQKDQGAQADGEGLGEKSKDEKESVQTGNLDEGQTDQMNTEMEAANNSDKASTENMEEAAATDNLSPGQAAQGDSQDGLDDMENMEEYMSSMGGMNEEQNRYEAADQSLAQMEEALSRNTDPLSTGNTRSGFQGPKDATEMFPQQKGKEQWKGQDSQMTNGFTGSKESRVQPMQQGKTERINQSSTPMPAGQKREDYPSQSRGTRKTESSVEAPKRGHSKKENASKKDI